MLCRPGSRPLVISAVTLAICSLLVWGANALLLPSASSEAGWSTPAKAKADVPASGTAVAGKPALTPAGYVYTSASGERITDVVRRLWPQTEYMTRAELEAALRSANHLERATFLRPGQQVVVPGYETAPIAEKPLPAARDFEVRAIYLTGTMAGSRLGLDVVRRWREAGGNAVVFDIKDADGILNVPFEHALAGKTHAAIPNLPKYVRYLHRQNMRAIARIALFRDERLVTEHPELAVRSKKSGQPWTENGKLVWTDSSNRAVQEYNLALAKYVAASGADEVQFDYVRFPAEGDQKDAVFAFFTEHPTWRRADVITDFVKRGYVALHAAGVALSLDVFGIMAWQEKEDLAQTGQDVAELARHCDIMAPMIYPSHFFNMEGYANPGDAPEHFISESMDRFRKVTSGSNVVLRPWLQAFAWRTKTYSVDYVITQVRTAREHGGVGFQFWNAQNSYPKPLLAMQEMRLASGKYFKGDELPGPSNTATPSASH
ncbi:MAG TPA: putative glycoside hydrolase [Terriglobales bacterium]|nr:putative glycoside hydrolase [Terriglobales bacterium]